MGSKEIIVNIKVGNDLEKQLKHILLLFKEEYEKVYFKFDFKDKIPNKKCIETIVEIEKSLGEEMGYVYKNAIISSQIILSRLTIEVLNRYGFRYIYVNDCLKNQDRIAKYCNRIKNKLIPIEVYVKSEKIDELKRICKIFSHYDIGIVIEPSCEVSGIELIRWFEEWKNNINVGLNDYFVDCIGRILMHITGANCRYNSCLGKRLVIGEDGSTSFCEEYLEETYLGKLDEFEKEGDIWKSDKFMECLLNQLKYRDECKKNCSKYYICQGGCPMNRQEKNCLNNPYIALYEHIGKYINDVIAKKDLKEVNSYIRKQILNAVAFGEKYE